VTPEEIVEFTEALARITASGGGPRALAAHLAQIAGGGVLLEDAQWRHLAAAGEGRVPSSARSVVESGAPGRAHRVSAGNVDVGWLSIFGTNSAADTELLLRLTAAAIAVELGRDATAQRGRKGSFWEDLFGRVFHDASAARDEAAARGIRLCSQYLTLVLEPEITGDERSAAPNLRELRALAADVFQSTEGDVGLLERGVMLFLFVPASRAVDASNATTAARLLPKNLLRRKPPLRISVGVGTVEPLLDVHAGGAAAQAALAIGRRMHGIGHVAVYDELGAYRLIYEGADLERLRAFSSDTLAPLRAYDEKHQTELERTLRLYFKVGENVKTAAAELNVHRHTVFYRLRQIGEICSRSLESPHDQLTLRLAVAIDELHESN
jgi:hypothetical protein